MNNQNNVITVRPDTVVAVRSISDSSEYWDSKQASEVLGRSRRTVARYIESGHLSAIKIAGPKGPEWRIVPFIVQKSCDLFEPKSNQYMNKIGQLERELELLKQQQQNQQQQVNEQYHGAESMAKPKDISPGLLQTVAAFFMISGLRLGLTPKQLK